MTMRRHFLASLASTATLGALGALGARFGDSSAATAQTSDAIQMALGALETASKGRLGVHVLDTHSGESYGYRADERFLMCSTFKVAACALALRRVDAGREALARRIRFAKSDLIPWSPITAKHVDEGMTLGELCAAAITVSDNTAANLILASFGGPSALTAYLLGLGDPVTRLDRNEPTLNVPDGELDTTSPRAMTQTLCTLLLGDALSVASRQQLQQWMLAATTGGARLKAGLPPDWRIADKTGTGDTSSNDIGIIWPPGRRPVLVAAYLAESEADGASKDAILASVGALVARTAR